MSFSDFPIPHDWPTFLHRSKVAEYLLLYSEHFKLEPCIKFNRRVMAVEPVMAEGVHTGQWKVVTQRCKKKPTTKTSRRDARSDENINSLSSSPTFGKADESFDYDPRAEYKAMTSARSLPKAVDIDTQLADLNMSSSMESGLASAAFPATGSSRQADLARSFDSARIKAADATRGGASFESSRSSKEPKVKEEIFDYVMVCTGHHWKPRMPDFKGMNTFPGRVIHSHSYRVPYPFKDESVLVIGVGNSGMDIANEISHHANQVYVAARTGTWYSQFKTGSFQKLPYLELRWITCRIAHLV
jgi:cation diffusion facilitator CzcD-associated flavoprotein CzcO